MRISKLEPLFVPNIVSILVVAFIADFELNCNIIGQPTEHNVIMHVKFFLKQTYMDDYFSCTITILLLRSN